MKHPLTLVYITARKEPRLEWFLESLAKQRDGRDVKAIIVDARLRDFNIQPGYGMNILYAPPKPTVWQGPHRLTREDWWAASNARNTGICLCETPWIGFVDDRSVLLPGYLDRIALAMEGNYFVCGSYEKVNHLRVVNGGVVGHNLDPSKDHRAALSPELAPCGGSWAFGCSLALPLEWALTINGFDETCDGCSAEDCVFGLMAENNGFPLKFDPRMKLLEDRTPGETESIKRADKGRTPNDKSHAQLAMLRGRKSAIHNCCDWNLRQIRADVLAGKPFPIPKNPQHDWYDGQPLSEM